MKNILFAGYSLIIPLILLATFQGNAQKLPNKQELSLRAPADIKIDGKSTEIKNTFAAHNPATGLFYSLTNDDKQLYLILQATEPDDINRIVRGGITFTVKNKLNKSTRGVSITYPVNKGSLYSFRLTAGKGYVLDTSPAAADSTMRANNKKLDDNFKLIKVTGVPDLDTLSIYNEEEFKAAGKFDINKVYTVEMSIPLKYLSTEIGQSNQFTYQVRVNGSTPPTIRIGAIQGSSDPAAAERAMASMQAAIETVNSKISAVTDFSADYELAK
ncbi:MAG: hypothetical protein ABI367_13185 [Mucilaginibacter sp.]